MDITLQNIWPPPSLEKALVSLALLAALSGCSQELPKAAHSHEGHGAHGQEGASHSAGAAPSSTRAINPSPKRAATAHTHGRAKLAIVLDGARITAALESPLYNIVGFEHEAETSAQKAAARNAESLLTNAGQLLTFSPKAECAPADNSITLELGGHDDDHHDDHSDAHKDIELEYAYHCHHPENLKDITVNLFEHFEHMSEIELIYLGPDTQKQDVLNRNKTRVKLTR